MKRVLIIDDSALMRRLMRKVLKNNGFEVVGEANDGVLGVEKYRELLPDIVTLDLIMDRMSGIGALERILEINPDANVFIVSSMGQEIIVREAISRGAKSFILKPFTDKQVLDEFSKVL